MFYKNWPYWLKDGIGGVIIINIILLCPFSFCMLTGGNTGFWGCSLDILLPLVPGIWFFNLLSVNIDKLPYSVFLIISLIFNLVLTFFVATVFGMIYRKNTNLVIRWILRIILVAIIIIILSILFKP
jgi:hypothetical protein